MHKDKLVQITEKTMQSLLQNEIIMPSKYLETFTEEMHKINHIDEVDNLKSMMPDKDEIKKHVNVLKEMEDRFFKSNKDYFEEINALRSDVDFLRRQLFSDDISESKNRLWVFKNKLTNNETFNDCGFLVSLKVSEYDKIVKEYDRNIGNKLLKQVSDYMIRYMNNHHCDSEIVRYMEDHFLIFMHDLNEKEVEDHIANMQNGMSNYTFKHRNKMFNLTFNSAVMQYIENESFSSVLDQLDEKLFHNKM